MRLPLSGGSGLRAEKVGKEFWDWPSLFFQWWSVIFMSAMISAL